MSPQPESLRIRLPKVMDTRLREMAKEQGIPLNTLVTVLLAEAMPFRFREDMAAENEDAPASAGTAPGADHPRSSNEQPEQQEPE